MKQTKRVTRGGVVAVMALATILALGVTAWLNRPTDAAEAPQAVAGGETVKVADGCELLQTLTYTRCEHVVTRRVAAPTELVGKTLGQVQPLYEGWQITEFGAKEIKMSCQPELFCPDHVVLMPDSAGRLCVFRNKYGDALALVTELGAEIGTLPAALQEEVRRGVGFDSEGALEQWLESAES